MKKIKLYTSETCNYCKQVKEELTKNDIKFEEKLIHEFKEEWQDIIMLTGLGNVPTVVFKDNILHPGRDYGHPAGLISLLKSNTKPNYSELRQTVEKLKTLNQNMVNAFQRVYSDLNEIKSKLNADGEDRITIKNK